MKRVSLILTIIAQVALSCFGKDDYARIINSMQYSPELEEYARQGNAEAQNTLGLVYKHGKGVEKNIETANYWFRQSASRGYDNAMVNLGTAYLSGTGVEKDPAKAAELFEDAAAKDNQAAIFNLATMYMKGIGVPRNPGKAFQYAEKAANAVHKTGTLAENEMQTLTDMGVTARAQAFLALCYRMGIGTQKDMAKSMEYLKRAAKNGEMSACMILADAYEHGKNAPKDIAVAENYYKKAADSGMSLAQYALGIRYASGETIRKNTSEAIRYLTQAVDNKNALPPVVKADALLKLAALLEAPGPQKNAVKSKQYRAAAATLPAPDPAEIRKIMSAD